MKIFLSLFFLLTFICFQAHAETENAPDYFPVATDEEVAAALEEQNLKNCDEFIEKYFNTNINDPKKMMQGVAYETGICVPQDLSKALSVYEKISDTEAILSYPAIYLRQAFLYESGPEDLRNPEKADFLMKQFAITFSIIPDRELKNRVIRGMLNEGQPLPGNLESHMDWIDEVLTKSPEERKYIAQALEKEGFMKTKGIWNPIEDYIPKE